MRSVKHKQEIVVRSGAQATAARDALFSLKRGRTLLGSVGGKSPLRERRLLFSVMHRS